MKCVYKRLSLLINSCVFGLFFFKIIFVNCYRFLKSYSSSYSFSYSYLPV
nr:MAG TPA: hypothetical protein [Caudoviricetes sp.]